MTEILQTHATAFDGLRKLASGPLSEVALAAKTAIEGAPSGPVLIYDGSTGRVIDVDTRGTSEEVLERLEHQRPAALEPVEYDETSGEPRGRGRPRLGVIAREVTLLPRHWDWLGTQPGGASVALRKLVEEARRTSGDKDRRRAAQEAAYRFMGSMAGNFPDYEEALRALFAYDRRRFSDLVAAWPPGVRDYAVQLAFSDLTEPRP